MAYMEQSDIKPSLEAVETLLSKSKSSKYPPNLVPLCAQIPADLLTPTLAYLRISAKSGTCLSSLELY
jgi:anthranilate synthase component 1